MSAVVERRIEQVSSMSDVAKRVLEYYSRHTDANDDFRMTFAGTSAIEDIYTVLDMVERGEIRAAYMENGTTFVNPAVMAAINLLFVVTEMVATEAGPLEWFDKIPLLREHALNKRRVVPGAVARRYSYVAPATVLMPCFVNLGAYIGHGTMIDTWATVGSCAQVGNNVHISGGVGLGGVLEPPGAVPVIIDDGAMIGSRCVVVEGAYVGKNAVLGAVAGLTGNTRIIDVDGSELPRGMVPANCIAVQSYFIQFGDPSDDGYRSSSDARTMLPDSFGRVFTSPCIRVVRYFEDGQRPSKTSLNDILRDVGATLG